MFKVKYSVTFTSKSAHGKDEVIPMEKEFESRSDAIVFSRDVNGTVINDCSFVISSKSTEELLDMLRDIPYDDDNFEMLDAINFELRARNAMRF